MVLVAILRGVPSELKATLAVKVMAKEEWVAVKTMCVGEDCVKATSLQRLLKEFENLQFKDGELIDNFAVRINTLVSGLLRELGEAVKFRRMVRKVLHVVLKKWKQVAVSIEMLLDLDKMSMELIGRLRIAEDADVDDAKAKDVATEGVRQLYLTKAQWEVRRRE